MHRSGSLPLQFAAQAGRTERRLLAGGESESLWRALFAVPFAIVERPNALFELTLSGGQVVALPSPERRLTAGRLELMAAADRSGLTSLQLRQAVALATTVAVTATSTPAVAVADGLGGAAGAATGQGATMSHSQATEARIASLASFAAQRLHRAAADAKADSARGRPARTASAKRRGIMVQRTKPRAAQASGAPAPVAQAPVAPAPVAQAPVAQAPAAQAPAAQPKRHRPAPPAPRITPIFINPAPANPAKAAASASASASNSKTTTCAPADSPALSPIEIHSSNSSTRGARFAVHSAAPPANCALSDGTAARPRSHRRPRRHHRQHGPGNLQRCPRRGRPKRPSGPVRRRRRRHRSHGAVPAPSRADRHHGTAYRGHRPQRAHVQASAAGGAAENGERRSRAQAHRPTRSRRAGDPLGLQHRHHRWRPHAGALSPGLPGPGLVDGHRHQ